MARRQSALTVHTDVSASAATVLPGVSLPAWAYRPEPAPEPTPEPEPEPIPELSYATIGAAPEHAPSYPIVADYPIAPAVPLTAFVPVPAALWGPPAADTAVIADLLPPSPSDLPDDPTSGATTPTDHRAPVDEASAEANKRGSRRLLLLVGGLVVALLLGAFAAFVTPGFLVSSSDGSESNTVPSTALHVLLPPSEAGYTKVTSPAVTAANTAATSALSAAGATAVAAATYSNQSAALVTVAAGLLLSVPAPDQQKRLFSAWADSVGATGTTTVAVPGTAAQCGTHSDGAVCVLITGRKVTTLNVPGATVPQAAALVPTFANIATVR